MVVQLTKLRQYVWFMFGFYFARRGRESSEHMTKAIFEFKTDDDDEEYPTMSGSEAAKNWQGGSSSILTFAPMPQTHWLLTETS